MPRSAAPVRRRYSRASRASPDAGLLDALAAFGAGLDAGDGDDSTVRSFVALFDGPVDTGEQRFEALLWSQLQRLHELDAGRGCCWASDVSSNPADPRFSLSLAGHPFFVIGLHAGASRAARRLPSPALVFNSHRQFDRLRADGRYAKMQAATRERDVALQGSARPSGLRGQPRDGTGAMGYRTRPGASGLQHLHARHHGPRDRRRCRASAAQPSW